MYERRVKAAYRGSAGAERGAVVRFWISGGLYGGEARLSPVRRHGVSRRAGVPLPAGVL